MNPRYTPQKVFLFDEFRENSFSAYISIVYKIVPILKANESEGRVMHHEGFSLHFV